MQYIPKMKTASAVKILLRYTAVCGTTIAKSIALYSISTFKVPVTVTFDILNFAFICF
jgi:hypothetical protein